MPTQRTLLQGEVPSQERLAGTLEGSEDLEDDVQPCTIRI